MQPEYQGKFPVPSPPPSKICARPWPIPGPSSTATLLELLEDSHNNYHVYLNRRRFNNHSSDIAITLWALGASGERLKIAYKDACDEQVPPHKSPGPINTENFVEHLGDENFYTSYLAFFADVVRTKGISEALEEYIFAPAMNFSSEQGVNKQQPEMLNRLLDNLFHPMIHVGYGAQFGLPGMVIQGLADAAVHQTDLTRVLPPTLFQPKTTSWGEMFASWLPQLWTRSRAVQPPPQKQTHALDIVARMLRDDTLVAVEKKPTVRMHNHAMDNYGEALLRYADQWTVYMEQPGEVERKIEELVWMNSVLYGVGGWKEGNGYEADFIHMHLVTTSVFLSSITAFLKSSSQELFLRAYFIVSLTWWVGHGRLGFDIPGFFTHDMDYLQPPPCCASGMDGQQRQISTPSSTQTDVPPNPWLSIIDNALVFPDYHLAELQRVLVHYGALYGSRQPGFLAHTELPHADRLDGSLFLRAAGLTAERMGRLRYGEQAQLPWDRFGPPRRQTHVSEKASDP